MDPNGTHCKHGIHYADNCPKCLPIYTEEDLEPLKNALHHFLSFGRPREGSDRYHKSWDKLKESFEGMK